MRLTRYVHRRIVTAAGATALAVMSAALAPTAFAQTTSAPVSANDARANDLQQLVATLNDPAVDQKARDEAARRLAARTSPEAKTQFAAALSNAGNPRGQQSIAKAITWQTTPDPKYIDPLMALFGSDRALSDAAGQALASYKSNPSVTGRLIDLSRDAQKHLNTRLAATTALGAFPEKRVAQTLVDLTGDNSTAIRNAAGDALVSMTGLTENGRDVARWQKWWGAQSTKSDAVFRDEMLVQQSKALNDAQASVQRMAEEMQVVLKDVYRATPDADARNSMLLKWMNSAEPQVRLVAARFIVEDFQNNVAISQPVKDQLRMLVGDSSPLVRLQVAKTIGEITDTASFNALLAQLSQEPVPDVKASIVTVLGAFDDLRAVPEIEKLLDDESMPVAEASAAALAKLGPRLRDLEPARGRELAKKLRQVFDDRGAQPGAERLRENLLEALAPLGDPDSLRLFMGLLKPNETERIRRASLRGIARIGDPNASDVVLGWLKTEPVASIRVEALIALGATSGTEHLQVYFDYFVNDRDKDVREQAWQQFSAAIPKATPAQIGKWTGQFAAYPEKRVLIYKALAEKYVASKQPNDLAVTRQNIGDALMQVKGTPEQRAATAAEAAVYFKLALDYHKEVGSPQNVTNKLIEQNLDALLAAQKYSEACKYAGEEMARDKEQIGLAGNIRIEAERLRDAKDYSSALNLIEEALKIKALNGTRFVNQLKEVETEINKLAKKNDGKNGTRIEHTNTPMAAT